MTEPHDSVDEGWSLDDPKSAEGFERTWDQLVSGLEPGDVIDDKYRLEGLVGHGAMGYVLRAWHKQLEEPVAVKFLLPELLADDEARGRFEREARAAFKIRSEHVTRVMDVGRLPEQNQPYIVMELLEGKDLGDLIDHSKVTVEEAVDYILQACHAVAEAHALGIVHRDLKPDNLFVTHRPNGTPCVKVLDFGLSKLRARQSEGKRPMRERALTRDAQIMGTAHYMSPEQWVAAKTVGPAADQWALGVILYELITGESPFFRNNIAAMCNAVLRDEPKPMHEVKPGVPPALDAVVQRALAKMVDERWPSVEAFAEALRPFAPESLAPPARASARGVGPPSSGSRSDDTVEIPPESGAGASPEPTTDLMLDREPEPALAPTEKPPRPELPTREMTTEQKSEAMPVLGLREGGTRERWSDVLESPTSRRSYGPLYALGALIVIGVLASAVFLMLGQ